MAKKPIKGVKLVVWATLIGHTSKEMWMTQVINQRRAFCIARQNKRGSNMHGDEDSTPTRVSEKFKKIDKNLMVVGIGLTLLVIIVGLVDSSSSAIKVENNDFQVKHQTTPKNEEVIQENFTNKEMTKDDVVKELESIRNMPENLEVSISDYSKPTPNSKMITIRFNMGKVSGYYITTTNKVSKIALESFETLFSHEDVIRVLIIVSGDFTTQYGQTTTDKIFQIAMNRPSADKVNWEVFKEKVYVDYKSLRGIVDSFSFNRIFADELDEQDKIQTEAPQYFEGMTTPKERIIYENLKDLFLRYEDELYAKYDMPTGDQLYAAEEKAMNEIADKHDITVEELDKIYFEAMNASM